ncbi:mucin-5AC [Leptopilina heterotoma]|uniref:mucin-5AC n=1 Tax=Leptopilina heterotoma TaxID=63436 RepID=UPI001CA8FEAC|nr:mucin-5AC [Leptopilina heterotoma]
MPSTTRESSHMSKKIVTHSGPISGQSHSAATASNLESNLDALLEDLQTTVSKPEAKTTTINRTIRSSSPLVEYRSAANSSKTVSESTRTVSPTRGTTTTTEKYITTGPAGAPSGIPGLELLDKELQDVQPGQSKTVAYKQVSYHYNKDLDGKPMDSWDNLTSPALIDSIRDRSYEESSRTRRRSPEPTKSVTRELTSYSDSSLRTRQPSPIRSTQKDVFYQESKESYRSNPRTLTSTSHEVLEDVTPAVPVNLAPGPNTKVTTTVKTYTYELPGAPDTYVNSSLTKNHDKSVTYSSTKDPGVQKTITYEVDQRGYRSGSPVRYSPIDVPVKSKTVHAEEKYFREERHGYRPTSPTYHTSSNATTIYHGSPSPTGTSSLTRREKFSDINGYGPRGPGDFTDHAELKSTTYYQSPVAPVSETRTELIEEHYSSRSRSPPRTYYPPVQTTSAKETIYKFEKSSKSCDGPKPFPSGGVKVYPTKPPISEGPPAKLEDLMASFSDTEKEVLDEIDRKERVQRRTKEIIKKEVEFTNSPPRSKAASPVYYPPGSELAKREGSGSMAHSSSAYMSDKGEWKRGMYEKESKSETKWKTKKGKVAIPLCLPLCCAAPCVIM